MASRDEGSVTGWFGELKSGNPEALGHLWRLYFERLVVLARGRLGPDGPHPIGRGRDAAEVFEQVLFAEQPDRHNLPGGRSNRHTKHALPALLRTSAGSGRTSCSVCGGRA